ncbi:MAG TPA: transposase [Paludibacter sp.]|nr:MAG: hypothetical protein BWY08_00342 [Bacteroidetes bacterium ADurb.Bin174]HQB27720.1 transposase [Paludibacter sp.]
MHYFFETTKTMTYNPNKHHRRSIRLKGYDYSQAGLYYITICTQNRACLFGKIENGKMILNDAGRMIKNEWLKLTERFKNIALHEYVVMPNHFHAILEIVDVPVGATLVVAPDNNGLVAPDNNGLVAPNNNDLVAPNDNDIFTQNKKGQPRGLPLRLSQRGKTVGDMVGAFASITTVKYIRGVKNNGWQPFNKKMWQRNYWEHIIRDEQSHMAISEYIMNNPANWDNDRLK